MYIGLKTRDSCTVCSQFDMSTLCFTGLISSAGPYDGAWTGYKKVNVSIVPGVNAPYRDPVVPSPNPQQCLRPKKKKKIIIKSHTCASAVRATPSHTRDDGPRIDSHVVRGLTETMCRPEVLHDLHVTRLGPTLSVLAGWMRKSHSLRNTPLSGV